MTWQSLPKPEFDGRQWLGPSQPRTLLRPIQQAEFPRWTRFAALAAGDTLSLTGRVIRCSRTFRSLGTGVRDSREPRAVRPRV